MNNEFPGQRSCFLLVPFARSDREPYECVADAARHANYVLINSDQIETDASQTQLRSQISEADVIIADVSELTSGVLVELGAAVFLSKQLILISAHDRSFKLPRALSDYPIIGYDLDSLGKFHSSIIDMLQKFSELHPQKSQFSLSPSSLPFVVDWQILDDREIENLCHELLAQLGYRKVEWGRSSKEIDLIAEYPRTDPDGFQFNELWMVSMGFRAPLEYMLEMAADDPEFFIERTLRHSDLRRDSASSYISQPVTFLMIAAHERSRREFDHIRDRLESRLKRRKTGRNMFRLRLWDQDYLTTLVQRHPNIGFKYFSDEGRARTKTRKSFEQLYQENDSLLSRQRNLNRQLKEERDLRVRAERDAVWKDISFSAAHKIGNPIFAIETGLDPLIKRIVENRPEEALQITESIEISVNKAKAFVEQFKSLAKAQKIEPQLSKIQPLLLDVQKVIKSQSVACTIKCNKSQEAWIDGDKISECFDELATNSVRWLEKSGKSRDKWKIIISAKEHEGADLPDFLDKSVSYVLIHFKDNGTGIEIEDKERIFEAFVTEYEHGTGLGLALVRRIIEGHGGAIQEVGMPKSGADFEIYLPLNSSKK